MARLIDADKFGMYLADVQLANRGWRDDVCELLDDVMYALEEESAIDDVGVVRSKDCKWYNFGKHFNDIKFCQRLPLYAQKGGLNTADDDFCSYGERKEE